MKSSIRNHFLNAKTLEYWNKDVSKEVEEVKETLTDKTKYQGKRQGEADEQRQNDKDLNNEETDPYETIERMKVDFD